MYSNLGEISSREIESVIRYSERGRSEDYITYLNTVEDYVNSVNEYENRIATIKFHSSPYEEDEYRGEKIAEIVMHAEAPMEQKYYRSLKEVYKK